MRQIFGDRPWRLAEMKGCAYLIGHIRKLHAASQMWSLWKPILRDRKFEYPKRNDD
jgi:hypothetical protein